MTIHLFRVNFYIGTVNEQMLAFVGHNCDNCFVPVKPGPGALLVTSAEATRAEFYVTLFTYILPAGGVLSVPVIGLFLDKLGLPFSLWALVLSGVLSGGCALLVVAPIQVQLVTFVLVAFFRALTFSVMATYVAVEFSFAFFGTLWGIIFFIGGIINVGIYFLVAFAEGEFFWINVGLSALAMAAVFFPLYLLRHPPPRVSVQVH